MANNAKAEPWPMPPAYMLGRYVRVGAQAIKVNSVGKIIFRGVCYQAIALNNDVPALCLAKVVEVNYRLVKVVRPEVYLAEENRIVPLDPPHRQSSNGSRRRKRYAYESPRKRYPYDSYWR